MFAVISDWMFKRWIDRVGNELVGAVRNDRNLSRFTQDFEIISNPGEIWTLTFERKVP